MRNIAEIGVGLTLLTGLLLLAGGVLLLAGRAIGEYSLPFDIQLVTYGVLVLFFGAVAGKLISRD